MDVQRENFDSLEVFDSAVFLEVALDKEKSSEARSKLHEVKTDPNRLPATTHDVLGEVNNVLHDQSLFESEYEREQALLNFKRAYNQELIFLLTPRPSKLVRSMEKVLETDNRIDKHRTDCYIISKAVCENADVLYTIGELGWSLKDLIEVERI